MAENGKLPDSALAPIAQGKLRRDAAASWNAMNQHARRLGVELLPTGSMSSYRTYQQQVYLYGEYQSGRGNLAAVPGTSNHGWGLAVDVASQAMRSMIDRIGQPYGWSKQTSDAPSEWWHLKWVENSWQGVDVGPYGEGGADAPLTPERVTGITSARNAAGALHVFAQADDGSIWYTFQPRGSSRWSGQANKRIAEMVLFAPPPGK